MNIRWRASVGEIILFIVPCLWLALAAGSSAAPQAEAKHRGSDLPVGSRTLVGIILGSSNLAGVREKLGAAKTWSEGDASTAEQVICYVTAEPHAVAIIFASNSEMAGPPNNEVTDITIMRSEAYSQRSKCGKLTIPANDIQTSSGLRLGVSQSGIRRILGPPFPRTAAAWKYMWSVNEPLPESDKNYQYWLSRKEECFDGKLPFITVSSQVEVSFEGGVVTALHLRRIESTC